MPAPPTSTLGPEVRLELTPGRRLRWSPPWDCSDETVLFDAASGDYWLLALPARALVQRIEHDGPATLTALQAGLPPEEAHALPAIAAALARAGVLRACQNGHPVRLAPAADAFVD